MSVSDKPLVNLGIEELDINVRTYNTLRRNGIKTVGDLLGHSMSELAAFANFGRVSQDDVTRALRIARLGLPSARCPHCGGALE